MSDNSLIELGELSKAARLLISKVSGAVGGIFKPYQIVRIAKAEAEADRIRAESAIQITDLQRRAMHRFLEEEATKQANIESITRQALPLLENDSSPELIDDDWIANFFDKCRIVSDEQMQQLWAKVLAGEANSPSKFSRKTVNLMADLGKDDAEIFQRLCRFVWHIGFLTPVVFDLRADVYKCAPVYFGSIVHLESLGLVHYEGLAGYSRASVPKTCTATYFGRSLELTFPNDEANELDVGHVLFTSAGRELATVCETSPVDGFFEYVHDRWANKGLLPKNQPNEAAVATP